MQNNLISKVWFYLTILPSFVLLAGSTIVFTANTFKWGSENNIPIPLLLALFFSEIGMVIAGLGIVGFIKTKPKTKKMKTMGFWNVVLMITACVIGYNIFMAL